MNWLKKLFIKKIYRPPKTLEEKIDYLLEMKEWNLQAVYRLEYRFAFSSVGRYLKELDYITTADLNKDTLNVTRVNLQLVGEITFLTLLSEDGYLPEHPIEDIKKLLLAFKAVNDKFLIHKVLPKKLPLNHNLRMIDVHIEHIERIVDMLYTVHRLEMT